MSWWQWQCQCHPHPPHPLPWMTAACWHSAFQTTAHNCWLKAMSQWCMKALRTCWGQVMAWQWSTASTTSCNCSITTKMISKIWSLTIVQHACHVSPIWFLNQHFLCSLFAASTSWLQLCLVRAMLLFLWGFVEKQCFIIDYDLIVALIKCSLTLQWVQSTATNTIVSRISALTACDNDFACLHYASGSDSLQSRKRMWEMICPSATFWFNITFLFLNLSHHLLTTKS